MARRPRNFSPWAYWMLRLAEVDRGDPCPTRGGPPELDAWRQRFRSRLLEAFGPPPEVVALNTEAFDGEDTGSYRRTRVVFDAEPTMSVPAYLLVPHDRVAPGPAVLAVHGHGPGKDEVCGLTATNENDYAHRLAARGYIVLAPDLRCFGERADWNPPDKYACDLNLVHALVAGANPLAQNLWDLARALDLLAGHPLVDPSRLGVVGLSYGGTLALFLAALDSRVRATVVSGYFGSLVDAHRVPWNLCGSQVLPGMLELLDHVDVGALVGPRALLVETGTEDPIFAAQPAREAVAALRHVYEADGAADALEHDVFDGGHRWNGARVEPFLQRWLGD
jgi:dienelactone hydrolase